MAGCGLTEIYERGELCGEQHLSRSLFPLVCKDTYQQKHMAYLSLYRRHCRQESSQFEHTGNFGFPSLVFVREYYVLHLHRSLTISGQPQ